MSSEERGQWIYLAAVTLTAIGYVVTLLSGAGGRPVAELDYVPAMLWAIGLTVVASVVGRILVELVLRGDGFEADVRDRDISRFGEFLGGSVLAVAMLVPFVLALTEADHFWIANTMYLGFVAGTVVSTVIKIVAYRRGL